MSKLRPIGDGFEQRSRGISKENPEVEESGGEEDQEFISVDDDDDELETSGVTTSGTLNVHSSSTKWLAKPFSFRWSIHVL